MTDAEFLCGWMEPKPKKQPMSGGLSAGWWWEWVAPYSGDGGAQEEMRARSITLNEIHLIEAKLTDEQWAIYATLMMDPAGLRHTRFLLHADAAAKVSALADTLDPAREVRGRR